jgi:rare lipoprotein A (peptidoglycan hydrolase)
MFLAKFHARTAAGHQLLRAAAANLWNVAHRSRFMVWTRLRGTTHTGEIYNPNGLTAASTTLPLGSHVRVTNPETGRSVVVRINDRGPFVRGRSLDLSHGAAQQIGLTGKGVGRVRVTPTASSTPAFSSITSTYSESSVTTTSRNVRDVSYSSRPRYVTVRRRHYRYTSSRRTVSNPIGAWLASGFPRF